MNVLVTGGAGYIGSHTVIELLKVGHQVTVIDNFSNSSEKSLERVERITGKKVSLYVQDLCDKSALQMVFDKNSFDAVIHFAGFKAVGESVAKPLEYYRNNIDSTLTLCEAMQAGNVKKIVFSSSATVYGDLADLPWKETSRAGIGIASPYAQTKFIIEQILRDFTVSDKKLQVALLRYFNPIGAHETGLIGEDPKDIPNNLLPYVSQVAIGKRKHIRVFGNDYKTHDGTGVRDYVHVVDVAKGHVAALSHMKPGIAVYNLGTGKGASVFEVIRAFEAAIGKKIPYKVVARRSGDIAEYFADASKANRELGWKAEKTLEDACRDIWRWQSQNPNGYDDAV